ncbi:MAG: outer membrane protein assembly factor BamC, partial [Pseudomonadota bacterium]|nr:outer membrane protein assembly factor BamC [Pseudomonadota bacterium]
MQHSPRFASTLALALALGALAACTTDSIIPDRRPDYRKTTVAPTLEVPPDLTASTIDDSLVVPDIDPTGSASLAAYASERAGGQPLATEAVLVNPADVRMERDGERRWLVVEKDPAQVWAKVRDFWISNGFLLKREDPRVGIMETEWVENRADIPKDPIRNLLGRVIDFAYSAPTRDKFRVRLERADAGTAVYLTHYGVEEVSRDVQVVWQSRPSDPELEAEMLTRLMAYLGAAERRDDTALAAATPDQPGQAAAPRSRIVTGGGGQRALLIDERYTRAWRLVGLALDGSNYAVEDQNRAQGLYVVERADLVEDSEEKGILSRLAFWKDDDDALPPRGTRYQVRLAGRGPQTLVMVYSADGEPDASAAAQQLLESMRSV